MSEKRRDNRNRILREGEYQPQMGGIGSVILTRMGKRKMFTVGVWTRMTQYRKARSGNFHYERKKNKLKWILQQVDDRGYSSIHSIRGFLSEFCGLTIPDIEFGEMRIKVDHQLQRTSQMEYVIQEPKTENGVHYVPITEKVTACFHRMIANRETPKVEPIVDSYIRFLCLDKNDMLKVALHWEKYLEHIIEKYNKIYRIQMPKVPPHICRHTFCSNMAKPVMNPKTLQYIIGHADISVTLNTNTHVNFDDAKEELHRVVNS